MYTNDELLTGSFTFAAEGKPDRASPYFYGILSHPSSQSGVTIGAGYDMGGRTEAQVKVDLLIDSGHVLPKVTRKPLIRSIPLSICSRLVAKLSRTWVSNPQSLPGTTAT